MNELMLRKPLNWVSIFVLCILIVLICCIKCKCNTHFFIRKPLIFDEPQYSYFFQI